MGRAGSLIAVLKARAPRTARAVRDALSAQLPTYAALPASECADGYVEELRYNIVRGLELAAHNEPNTAADLERFADLGQRRGLAGFPIADMVTAFDLTLVVFERASWAVTDARNYAEMAHLTGWAAREVPRTRQAAALAYAAACRVNGQHDPSRMMLIQQLLAGIPAGPAAAAAATTLPSSYLVLLCTPAHPSQIDAERRAAIGLALRAVPGALWHGGLDRLIILLPVDGPVDATRAVAAELVTELAAITGQPVYAAQAWQPRLDAIPGAVREASQVLAIVTAIPDATTRPYRHHELLVELAIAGQPAIAEQLAALLAPLQKGSDLHATLQALFAADLDRQRAAATLQIHRRTLTYRLTRIRELSGIDPGTAHGIALLRAALTATTMSRP